MKILFLYLLQRYNKILLRKDDLYKVIKRDEIIKLYHHYL